ncbi:trypsin-like serine protease [Myxococcus sp. AS-1-15]|uniref:S1 family peptidase n=1 Tax=Myxococcus sp. AS-1-15 TaxID=2874600 RepID=UPI001CBFF942|nr:trypsin-like serine protease [Myxococcus sp. AS-1-15]MBZ4402491.1 trypsin-like serine protease [Myxococcus sp. AS-1-15]
MTKLLFFAATLTFSCHALAAPPKDVAAKKQLQLLRHISDPDLLVVRGTLDSENIYDSVVLVKPDPTIRTAQEGLCSGTLIAPDIVLTAAHCSCAELPKREDGTSQMDASRCESRVRVGISLNSPVGEVETSTTTWVSGHFLPNKDFLVKYDSEHNLGTVEADIALIRLVQPIKGVKVARLPEEYPQAGAEVVLVGFGADEYGIMGLRRFGSTQIESATPEQITLIDGKVKAWKGDSGGAVFANGPNNTPRLVGVISHGSAVHPTVVTSTFFYRTFCATELDRSLATAVATTAPTTPIPATPRPQISNNPSTLQAP